MLFCNKWYGVYKLNCEQRNMIDRRNWKEILNKTQRT